MRDLTDHVRAFSRFSRVLAASGALASCGGGDSTAPASVRSLLIVLPVHALEVGQTTRAAAFLSDAKGGREEVFIREWSASSPVLSINSLGEITAVSPGRANIIASRDGLRAEASLAVHLVRVARVDLAPAYDAIDVGKTVQFTATMTDAGGTPLSGRVVQWYSSDSTVATISPNGSVAAHTVGPVRITARSDSVAGMIDLYVRDPMRSVTTIEIAPMPSRLTAGDSVQLNVTLRDTAGRELTDRTATWLLTTVSGTGAARLTEGGMLVAVAPGTVNLEVVSEGRRALLTIQITDNTDPSIVVTFAKPLEGGLVGDTLQVYVSIEHPHAPVARVVAVLNEQSIVLQKVAVGFSGLGEAWVGAMDVSLLRYGRYELVVAVTDARSRLGVGRQRFTRDVKRGEGGSPPGPRSK